MERKLGELIPNARAALASLLSHRDVKSETWYLRVATPAAAGAWQELTLDSDENTRRIREAIARVAPEPWEAAIAFVGQVERRGVRQLMVHMQYFQSDRDKGLLCGIHLRRSFLTRKFSARGPFLVMGGALNHWKSGQSTASTEPLPRGGPESGQAGRAKEAGGERPAG